jgi:hypothetical protein
MEGEAAAAPEEMVMAEEQDPMMMEEKKPSEKAMSEKAMSEKEENKSTAASEDLDESQFCSCCCCLCHCSDKEYRDLTCCGCLPIKCGIYSIGILAFFIATSIFLETFMMLMSD